MSKTSALRRALLEYKDKTDTPNPITSFVYFIVALWRHIASAILVKTTLGNGLLPDGTKPLPEPMLTYHQEGPVASEGNFTQEWP